ncbi:MAG: serine/threonine-protein phosphatase [Deltaproteobacteria bacterium]|nr:serine/threonine-protein phosphatase [Deltaproteobacteria bacterium]
MTATEHQHKDHRTVSSGFETMEPTNKDIFIEVFGRTDIGVTRDHNEDTFLVADLTSGHRDLKPASRRHRLGPRGTLLMVCDGMGGAASGEVASQLAVDTIYAQMDTPPPPTTINEAAHRIIQAMETANGRILAMSKQDASRRGMGTTCSAALIVESHLLAAQVGDSRVYVLRDNRLRLVTKDQSLLNQLIDTGQITEDQAATFQHTNVILQALGVMDNVVPILTKLALKRNDRILVCSDGLTGPVSDDEILEIITQHGSDLVASCKALTDRANDRGGPDNITVILAEVRGPDLPLPDPEAPIEFTPYLPHEPDSLATLKGGARSSAQAASQTSEQVKKGDSPSGETTL